MSNFYTYFGQHKSDILISGYKDGKKFNDKIPIKPYLFVESSKESPYKTMDGAPVSKVDFSSPWEARNFIKEYEQMQNFKVYGSTYFDYVHMYDHYKDKLKPDNSLIRIGNYDIETDCDDGSGGLDYANLETVNKEIWSITIHVTQDKEVYCLGYKDYDPNDCKYLKDENLADKQIVYVKCKDEVDLLMKFIRIWQKLKMDCITGWYINGYDHVYTIRRIARVLGEEFVKKLSPFGLIEERKYEMYGKEQTQYEIIGIPTLDYIECYKKFSFKSSESYALDYISHVELNKKKLEYKKEYKNLSRLYRENSNMFYAYNIIDVIRVAEIEEKMKFIDLMYSLAHFTKTNALDGFSTVKPCDVVIHNELMDRNIVIPHKKDDSNEISRMIAGGFVKEPLLGHHEYVMSFDFTSLYPHLIMAFNISPETFMGKIDKYDNLPNIDAVIDGAYDEIHDKIIEENMCISPKGTVFTKDKQGIFPYIMKKVFTKRKEYKDIMSSYKKKAEAIKLEMEKDPSNESLKADYKDAKANVVQFHNAQLAVKIFANAFYGGIANPYSRWFSYDLAETITISGQMSVKWTAQETNKFLNKVMKNKNEKDYIIAIDTDSMYLNVSDMVHKFFGDKPYTDDDAYDFLEKFSHEVEKHGIEAALVKIYNATNIYDQCLHMKIEAIGQAVWRAAKTYIMSVWAMEGIKYNKPEIKMVGIEAVRSSTPEVCRNYIKDALMFIVKKDSQSLKNHIKKCSEEFYELPFDKVAIPKGVTEVDKWVDKHKIYKSGVPYHVRAAIVYNNLLKQKGLDKEFTSIKNGDKMRLSYMKMPNPLRENVFACPDELPAEFGLDEYVDKKKQLEKTFLGPISTLASIAGIDLSNKGNLDDFY